MLDRLDEISRRDFLKGVGATAGAAALGAPKGAKAQIGAGEDLANDAASRVARYFKMLSQNTNPALVNQIYEGVYKDVLAYQRYSNGRGIDEAVDNANGAIGQFLEKSFDDINKFLEKDKENDPSVLGYLGRGLLGVPQPPTGMRKFDLSSTVQRALRVYRQSLNQSLENLKGPAQQTPQPGSQRNLQNIPQSQTPLTRQNYQQIILKGIDDGIVDYNWYKTMSNAGTSDEDIAKTIEYRRARPESYPRNQSTPDPITRR